MGFDQLTDHSLMARCPEPNRLSDGHLVPLGGVEGKDAVSRLSRLMMDADLHPCVSRPKCLFLSKPHGPAYGPLKRCDGRSHASQGATGHAGGLRDFQDIS